MHLGIADSVMGSAPSPLLLLRCTQVLCKKKQATATAWRWRRSKLAALHSLAAICMSNKGHGHSFSPATFFCTLTAHSHSSRRASLLIRQCA